MRRDNCRLVKNTVTTVLNYLLIDQDPAKATRYAKEVIADLLRGKCDISLLVISKSLGKLEYANKQAHAELAKRMFKRDPSTAPVVGDRVAYIITKAAKGAKAFETAEDPLYVLEHDIPIDTHYYLNNQLRKPLERIFEPILKNLRGLFEGEHTRTVNVSKSSQTMGGLVQFTRKRHRCLGCKAPLAGDATDAVCAHCHDKKPLLYMEQMEKVRECEKGYSAAWVQCQRCTSTLHQSVLCSNRDCPIFYHRKKVQHDLKDVQQALDRFEF